MPQFEPGESRVAKVTMRNPTTKAFDYVGILYMGTNLMVMSEASFSLGASQEKLVDFPVTLPTEPGTYPVNIGVFSGGINIALYRATEDVVILAPVPAVFEYASALSVRRTDIPTIYDIEYSVSVRNVGAGPGVLHLSVYQSMCEPIAGAWTCGTPPNWSSWSLEATQSATIGPGGTVTFKGPVERSPYIYRLKAVSEAGELIKVDQA